MEGARRDSRKRERRPNLKTRPRFDTAALSLFLIRSVEVETVGVLRDRALDCLRRPSGNSAEISTMSFTEAFGSEQSAETISSDNCTKRILAVTAGALTLT